MLDKRVIVIKDKKDNYWYTLQVRRVYFLFRSRWTYALPMFQPSYDDALNLLNEETLRE